MPKTTVDIKKQPSRFNSKAIMFYIALILLGANLTLAAVPPYDMSLTLYQLVAVALLAVDAIYLYYDWHPERSEAFKLGAATVVNVVHDEGIMYYERDGEKYAIYSNKVGTEKDRAKH